MEKFLRVGYGIHNVRFILRLSIGWRLFFTLTADMWCFCSHLPHVLLWSSFWRWIQWAITLCVGCSKLYMKLSRHERWACYINKGFGLSIMMHQNPKGSESLISWIWEILVFEEGSLNLCLLWQYKHKILFCEFVEDDARHNAEHADTMWVQFWGSS